MRKLLLLLSIAFPVHAACTGSSPTWTATLDSASVQTCVNNASSGDTINVGAGTQTYGSPVNVSKKVSIIGAGIGSSIINGNPFTISGVAGSGTTVSVRISGFTFNFGGGLMTIQDTSNFRLDHDAFNNASGGNQCLQLFSTTAQLSGLFDHDTFSYCRFVMLGGDFANDGNWMNKYWSAATPAGTINQVYFEDNTGTFPDPSSAGYLNMFDSNIGGSYVIRFNTFDGARIEAHGPQADNQRGTRNWEVYNNSFVNSHGINGYWPLSQRGGSGFVFHNTLDANWINAFMRIDGPRENEGSIAGSVPNWQFCDGLSQSANISGQPAFTHPKTVIVDGAGTVGYRCLDQIGAGPDASTWVQAFTSPKPAQGQSPAYIWKNILGGSEMPVTLTCEGTSSALCSDQIVNIQVNRDWYIYNGSFTGTSGIGEGPIASRPATCTVGVGYWATDLGSWNTTLPAGTSGQFYQCTATNTWSLAYVPLTYPNPLEGSTPPVVPPKQIITIVGPTIANVKTGGTLQFAATCNPSPCGTISWGTNAGTINGSGLLTAPASPMSGSVTATVPGGTPSTFSVNVIAANAAPVVTSFSATITVTNTFPVPQNQTCNCVFTLAANGNSYSKSCQPPCK